MRRRSPGAADRRHVRGGAVQDVRIYGRMLTAAEVQSIARLTPLAALVTTSPDQRSPEQLDALYDHYLITRDAEFPSLAEAIANLTEYEWHRDPDVDPFVRFLDQAPPLHTA